MKKNKVLLTLALILMVGLSATGSASATPSASFREVNDDIFDDWGISRTRAAGEDGFYQVSETGFRPVITFESLGQEAGLTYNLGSEIAGKYPDRLQRANRLFYFVRDNVNYTPDIDQFQHDEFAQNADEMAATIMEDGRAYGDCEDSAVLLAVMYRGAGYRSAIAVAPGHTAALVYLPEHKKSLSFELEGESGWVWAEATGSNNELGWVPKEFIDVRLAAYEITEETITASEPATAPSVAIARTGGGGISFPFSFFGVLGFLWFISLFRRRRPR